MFEDFESEIAKAQVLLEALPYLQRFRGQTMVIKYGGSAMERPELVEAVLRDIVFLELVGVNPVVVHGGGKAISGRLREEGIESKFVGGLRVTDADAVAVVEDILSHVINPDIVQRIQDLGGRARSISGKKVFRARKCAPVRHEGRDVDLGYVGEMVGCDVLEIIQSIQAEVVPVISPLGQDDKGQIYNVNADLAACEAARSLKANKMIFLSDVNGVLRDPSDPSTQIPTVCRKDVETLKNDGIITGGMIPKVDSSLRALEHGVEKVHFVDGRLPHALLLELFTKRGIGTEIINDPL